MTGCFRTCFLWGQSDKIWVHDIARHFIILIWRNLICLQMIFQLKKANFWKHQNSTPDVWNSTFSTKVSRRRLQVTVWEACWFHFLLHTPDEVETARRHVWCGLISFLDCLMKFNEMDSKGKIEFVWNPVLAYQHWPNVCLFQGLSFLCWISKSPTGLCQSVARFVMFKIHRSEMMWAAQSAVGWHRKKNITPTIKVDNSCTLGRPQLPHGWDNNWHIFPLLQEERTFTEEENNTPTWFLEKNSFVCFQLKTMSIGFGTSGRTVRPTPCMRCVGQNTRRLALQLGLFLK